MDKLDTVARRLKWARDQRGWTQTELSKEAGVAQGTVGNIEASTRTARPSLPDLAEALGVRHKWLRDGEDPVRAPHQEWPFPGIDQSRFLALSHDQQMEIQGVVRDRIESFEAAASAANDKRA